ncbi:MAG: hypothetical protein ABIP75_13840 [Pyrinomonadaceae bacterium]
MKLCPTCNRNYADDTLIFCTDDGANLTAAYDPNATWQIPAARNTDPPATELIPPQMAPGYQGSGTWPAQPPQAGAAPIPPTVPAAGATPPPFQPPPYQAPPAVLKKSNTPWIAASAVLAIVALGLVGVLGYMLLRSDQPANTSNTGNSNIPRTPPNTNNSNNDNSSTTNTSSTNDNTGIGSGNGNGGGTGDGGGNDATWLEGTWTGSGTQYDGGKWTFKYVNANGEHKIDYPSVKCGGKWEPVSIKSAEATFTEKITYGKNCINDGRVVVTKTDDGGLNCKWYYVGDIIGAEANLHKE